jgi:hypothetical protein
VHCAKPALPRLVTSIEEIGRVMIRVGREDIRARSSRWRISIASRPAGR